MKSLNPSMLCGNNTKEAILFPTDIVISASHCNNGVD